MSTLKSINAVRRKLMRSLTRNIGSGNTKKIELAGKTEIKKILICRPNHRLGNLLLITPLLQEVASVLPKAQIDLFVKGSAAPLIFKNYNNINRIIRLPKKPFKELINYIRVWTTIKTNRYDLVINVDNGSSSGRLSTKFANAKYRLFGDINDDIRVKHSDFEHMAKYPVYSFRDFLLQLGYQYNHAPVPILDLRLDEKETAEGKRKLDAITKNDKRTICIFTYATGPKRYTSEWWNTFYERLKKEYDDFNIIEMLPVENVSMIDFKAPSFYSKDIREIGSVIANCAIFIGADSGMMHLASSVQTATVGLFSVTNENVYRPYGNSSVSINTNETNLNDWIKNLNGILKEVTL